MEKREKKYLRASKIIALSTIGVLIIAGLTLSFIAEEPTKKSGVIKIYTKDNKQEEEGSVSDVGAKKSHTYTLNVENRALTQSRNVTIKWTTPSTGWSVNAKFMDNKYESIVISSGSIEEVEVTVKAPSERKFGDEAIVKIYAWEYYPLYGVPDINEQNTTSGADGGEVVLTTKVVHEDDVSVGPATAEDSRKTGLPGQTTTYSIAVRNTGTKQQRFSLFAEVSKGRATLWPDAIVFYPDQTSSIVWNQEELVGMEVKVPIDADTGIYTIRVTVEGTKNTDTFDFKMDVPEPDLFIDALTLSHDTILDGQTLTINARIGNKGSIVTDKFSVEISAKTPEGSWEVAGTQNITELEYQDYKTVSVKYTVKGEGLLTIRARVDPTNNIKESETTNNIVEKEIEVLTAEEVEYSFYTHIILIIAGVGAVTVFSMKTRQKKKQKK